MFPIQLMDKIPDIVKYVRGSKDYCSLMIASRIFHDEKETMRRKMLHEKSVWDMYFHCHYSIHYPEEHVCLKKISQSKYGKSYCVEHKIKIQQEFEAEEKVVKLYVRCQNKSVVEYEHILLFYEYYELIKDAPKKADFVDYYMAKDVLKNIKNVHEDHREKCTEISNNIIKKYEELTLKNCAQRIESMTIKSCRLLTQFTEECIDLFGTLKYEDKQQLVIYMYDLLFPKYYKMIEEKKFLSFYDTIIPRLEAIFKELPHLEPVLEKRYQELIELKG